jgi:hypothetical protein
MLTAERTPMTLALVCSIVAGRVCCLLLHGGHKVGGVKRGSVNDGVSERDWVKAGVPMVMLPLLRLVWRDERRVK